jgi:tetratricopeptide (TPR) repeat protein
MMTADEACKAAGHYSQSGQFLPAEHMYRFALQLNPRHAAALHGLGQVLYRKGSNSEAIIALRKSLELNPENADGWSDLGAALCRTQTFAEAEAACAEALRLRPKVAPALSNLGYALMGQGKPEQAIAVLEEAIRVRPNLAGAHANLGIAFKCLDRPEEALAALAEAHRLDPANTHTANTTGIVLQREGKLERALEFYLLALRLQPNYTDALNNLATCYKELGQFEEAIARYHRALQLEPDHALAYYNLSELAVGGRYQFSAEEIATLRRLFAAEDASNLSRTVAGFALGAVLDVQGSYDEAFGVYEQVNALRRGWLQANNRAFDHEQHRAFVDDIIATFDRKHFQRPRDWGTDSELPVFILGMPRAGTTLVEQIVASHPAVHGAGELGEFPRLVAQVMGRKAGLPKPEPFPGREAARDVAARHLRTLVQLGNEASRVTVKLPENVFYLGLLAELFPRARAIYCRRDPRDVCLSCYFHNFQHMDFAFSFEDVAVYYRQYERLMAHWRCVLPIPIYQVRYEDLLADQEGVTRGLISYCGLPWDERCLRFHNSSRPVQTASTVQVRRPLTGKSAGRWKHYQKHLAPLLEALKANGVNPEMPTADCSLEKLPCVPAK